MSAGNEREFIDHLQKKEQLENKAVAVGVSAPVRCSRCHWEGYAYQLKPIAMPDSIGMEGVTLIPACPACLSDQYLEYKED